MTELESLAELTPKVRDAEKKARVLELAEDILKARKKRVSLADIATGIGRLKERPISVSPDYVREIMTECHREAWATAEAEARKATKAKGRKKAKRRGRIARTAEQIAAEQARRAAEEAAAKAKAEAEAEAARVAAEHAAHRAAASAKAKGTDDSTSEQPATPKGAWLTQDDMQKELERADT